MSPRRKTRSAGASTELLSDQPGRQRPAVRYFAERWACFIAVLSCIGSTCYVVRDNCTEAYCNETRRTEA